jgi:hypothetical protein
VVAWLGSWTAWRQAKAEKGGYDVPIIRVTFRVGRRNFLCTRFPLARGLVDSGEAIPAGGPELLGQEHDVAGTAVPADALEAPKARGAVHTGDVTAVSKHPGPWAQS